MRVVWIVPEEHGGIRAYAEMLWPYVARALAGCGATPLSMMRPDLSRRSGIAPSIREIASLEPDLVHVQHEYGLFGGKNPPFYTFPSWLDALRRAHGRARVVATAHTVLPLDYRFPVRDRGLQVPLRWLANGIALPALRRTWNEGSWGALDGAIVHSAFQAPLLRASGCPRPAVIPHFVLSSTTRWAPRQSPDRWLLVFGFFATAKGQDLAIEALAKLPRDVSLLLAGSVRREADRPYYKRCLRRIEDLGLSRRVRITGYLQNAEVDALYPAVDLVLLPFRATTGSGSLVQALARGAPVVASDLTLNREVESRSPGCLDFFRAGDAEDLARRIRDLLPDRDALLRLSAAGLRYAEMYAPERTAGLHVDFYRSILRDAT